MSLFHPNKDIMMSKGKLWLCTLFLAGFWSCSDDSENINEEITTEDISNVHSIDESSSTFMDAITISNDILADAEVINGRIQQCYAVSETQNQNQLLVSFEAECEGSDGKVRSGSFLIEWSGSLETQDFMYTLSFDDYSVDGYGIVGSTTVSNLTFKENGFGFNVVIDNGLVDCPDGKQINYEQDFNYDFTFGELTEIKITGSTNGQGKEGNSYTANIKDPLVIVSNCEYAVAGSFEATFNGRPPVTVDYGDGSCDNKATASRGDLSTTFELD